MSSVNVPHFNVLHQNGVDNTGTTECSAALAQALTTASSLGLPAFFPSGEYLIESPIQVFDFDYLSIVGVLNKSRIKGVGVENLFDFRRGNFLRIFGMFFDGSAVGDEPPNVRLGSVRINGVKQSVVTDNHSRGSVNTSCLLFTDCSSSQVSRHTVRDSWSNFPNKSATSGVHFFGPSDTISVRDCDIELRGLTNPLDIGINLSTVDLQSEEAATQSIIVNNHVHGTARHGIGAHNENPVTEFSDGEVIISSNIVTECLEQGIKIKNTRRVKIHDNYVSKCNSVPEADSPSLRGGIFLNGNGQTTCTGNTILDDFTMGIRAEGGNRQSTVTEPRDTTLIGNNIVWRCAEGGIVVSQRSVDTIVEGNNIVECESFGVSAGRPSNVSTPADDWTTRLSVISNHIARCQQGVIAADVTDLVIHGNTVAKSTSHNIIVDRVDGLKISGNYSTNSAGGMGVRIGQSVTSASVLSNVIFANLVGFLSAAPANEVRAFGNDLRGNTTDVQGTYPFWSPTT